MPIYAAAATVDAACYATPRHDSFTPHVAIDYALLPLPDACALALAMARLLMIFFFAAMPYFAIRPICRCLRYGFFSRHDAYDDALSATATYAACYCCCLFLMLPLTLTIRRRHYALREALYATLFDASFLRLMLPAYITLRFPLR